MAKRKTYLNPVDAIDDKAVKVELSEPVEPDKFDRHMRKARRNDITSRRKVFLSQSEADTERDNQRQTINTSVY